MQLAGHGTPVLKFQQPEPLGKKCSKIVWAVTLKFKSFSDIGTPAVSNDGHSTGAIPNPEAV